MSTPDEASTAIKSVSTATSIESTPSPSTVIKPQEMMVVESYDSVTAPSNEEALDDTKEEPEEEDGEGKTNEEQEETNHPATKDEESAHPPINIPKDDDHLGEASLVYKYKDENPIANDREENPYETTTDEIPAIPSSQDLEYEDAAPSRRRGSMFGDATGSRRNSLVERVLNWTTTGERPVTPSAQDLEYEDAAPSRRRGSMYGDATGSRRDSLIERVLNWTGHGSTGDGGGNRRGSVDFMGGLRSELVHSLPQSAKFRAPSIGDEELNLFDEHGDPIPQSTGNIKGKSSRRNSLQDMLEKAMTFVNLRPNFDKDADDDLTPFGTRRDSLFSTS
jgi:hypothetical protein